jgi:hypothetical protein
MDLSRDFIGRVIYNEDPTFSGRCKVRVFGLFDDIDDNHIPWFTPQASSVFSSERGAGSLSVPKVDAIVRVRFAADNLYSGEYSNLQNIDPSLIEEIKNDYQNTHVILYDADKELVILYQPMTGYKMYLAGSMIKIDSDGSIQMKHKNNSNVIEINDSDINITSTAGDNKNVNGVVNISSGATVNITAPTVNVNSSSINLGEKCQYKAVNGQKLIGVLQQIATELNSKFPAGASTLIGRDFKEILSNTVSL